MNQAPTTETKHDPVLPARRPRELFDGETTTAPIAGDRMTITRGHLAFTRGSRILEMGDGKRRMTSYHLAETPSSVLGATDHANLVAHTMGLEAACVVNEPDRSLYVFEFR